MRFWRSLAAVLAGFGIFIGALRLFPAHDLAPLLMVTVAAAIVGGYVTSLIAGIFEFPHCSMVGMLMIGYAFTLMVRQGVTTPGPYHIVVAGCGPVAALFGAAIRLLTKQRRTPPARPAVHSPEPASRSNR